MPIYEYKCASCGNEFEALVRNSAPASACPQCHGTELTKKLSTFSAISKTAFGAVSSSAAMEALPAGCPSCGDPRGPGSCQLN